MTTFRVQMLLETLTQEYETWLATNGLDLGSADEHLFDESLTITQRVWLHDFVQRWEAIDQ